MRFCFLLPAAVAALIAGAAQATPNPAAPAVSAAPPSAAPIVYCPQVIIPPACRGATSGGGGVGVGHGGRVVTTTRYSRRSGADSGHRRGGESYAYARRGGSGYGRYASGRYDVTVRTGRVRVRGGDEGRYARVERDDYDVDSRRDGDRGEGRVRYAGPGSGPGYHDTWSGWGGRYGAGDRHPSGGYGYRYSEEGSDRVVEHRRVEGSGGGYRDGESYSYSYRSPPQVDVYEHHGYRGEDRRVPPPGADRYGDRYDRHDDGDRDDRARGRGHDADDRGGDDDDKGPGGDAGDHHRYAGGDDRDDGRGHDGRGHDSRDHDGMGRDHDGAYAYHHGGHGDDRDGHGAGGHREVYVFQHDGYGRGGHGGDSYAYGGGYAGGGYASSSSSYSSSSSSHGYSAYGARFYSGGCQQCQAPLRGNGYYAFSQGEDGALTWQNRDDDQ